MLQAEFFNWFVVVTDICEFNKAFDVESKAEQVHFEVELISIDVHDSLTVYYIAVFNLLPPTTEESLDELRHPLVKAHRKSCFSLLIASGNLLILENPLLYILRLQKLTRLVNLLA